MTSVRRHSPHWHSPHWHSPHWHSRRLLRSARTLAAAVAVVAMVSVTGLVIAFTVTPSVSNAMMVVRAQDRSHGVRPGPPVPRRFAAALIATEDHRFYGEPGIDVFAIARVAWARLTGGSDQGGATLYQQLAKMLYTPGQTGIGVEAEQVALAIKLRYSFSSQQILRMYADVAYFGNGYWGLTAASCGYFSRPASQLSWPQAALLAGLVQAPSADDPLHYPANARAREIHVIGRLVAVSVLTPAQARAALATPLSALLDPRPGRCPAS